MIFRLSQKLCTKVKAGPLQALSLAANPYVDWSAHLFLVNRTQYIILSNTKSFYSTLMFGKGITDDRRFIESALRNLQEFMEDDGQAFIYQRFIAPASGLVQFGKALNRAITGSMNDLINHATALLVEGKLSPFDVSIQLNDVLLSAIAPSRAEKYGKPKESFKRLGESNTSISSE
jgi:hypothetical protein